MKILNEYAISIIVISLLSVLLENLLPEGHSKKYTGLLIGLLVMLVILKPIASLTKNINSLSFSVPSADKNIAIPTPQPYVAESFEKKLADAISDDLFKTYGKTVSCRVKCDINESGQIVGFRRISIHPHTQDMAKHIAETYGVEEAIITP